ncbi:MAG: septum site-determining protein MinC [Psychromonas sp.]|nr:septum site-determining protein MinC [Psychromonas sp.]
MTLKSLSFLLFVVSLKDGDLSPLIEELHKKSERSPSFFKFSPIVIHVDNKNPMVDLSLDFKQIRQIILDEEFILVGISGDLTSAQKDSLHRLDIAVLKSANPSLVNNAVKTEQAEVKSESIPVGVHIDPKAQLHQGKVRSGQQVYAKENDLVILGDVNAGAEVIADGNVYIYGVLRGRALAGATGDQDAAVYCTSFAPELVSIAGTYNLTAELPEEFINTSCVVKFKDKQLEIVPLYEK